MNEESIVVQKTARYFTLGSVDDEVDCVWFICHGYGNLAAYFLKKFEALNNGKNFIVAPEGLHRFYVKGYNGRVGASWMTREDRLNDIKDYTGFLQDLYQQITHLFKGRKVKINVLGFSQGAATVCRWLYDKKPQVNNLILWAGVFPPDLNLQLDKSFLDALNLFFVIGDKDEFIPSVQVEEWKNKLSETNIKYRLIKFDGKHEINTEVLKELEQRTCL